MRLLATMLILTAIATGQVTYLGNVGSGQSVPDPAMLGPPGTAVLSSFYCSSGSSAGLNFTFFGLPVGYNTPFTQELIYFTLDVGASALPGVSILQGQFYVPFTAPVHIGPFSSAYLGPGDIISCPGLIFQTAPPGTYTTNGARINLQIPPGATGPLTLQGWLFDPAPAVNRIFTSNAINLTLP